MGQTSPCVLGLFLLMSLHYSGHAEDVVLTLQPNWSTFFTGESVTFICDVKDGEETDWDYRIKKDNQNFFWYQSNKRFILQPLETGYSAKYQCFAHHKRTYEEKRSNIVSLTVSDKPTATILPGRTTIPAGSRVTLTCSVDDPAEWRYYWYRRTSGSSEDLTLREGYQSREISVSQGGTYWCRGGRGNPLFYTHGSYEVTIWITFSNRVTLTSQPIWSQMFTDEKITLTCDIQGGGDTEWQYEWTTPWSSTLWTDVNYWSTSAVYSGEYKCRGRNRRDLYSSTQLSEGITKTVSPKPKAQLRADVREIPAGGNVTLTCSVNPSSGWKYDLYRDNKLSEPLNPHDAAFKTSGKISVSQTGVYRCRGGRGDPVYYTEDSQDVRIVKTVPNRAVVTLEPNWPEIYRGEKITVSCEIQGGGDTEWTYEWETPASLKPPNQHEYRISAASSSHSGDYRCRGRVKSDGLTTTEWSDSVRLTVYDDKPRPVLTVSPSWLSPGASVTLKCEVGLQSAGWKFFWSKAVPDPSQLYYSSELLPGSSNGTEQDSYMVHGQTHTAGYMCQAGRGDPVIYTETSEPTFVWSGDVDPSASLTVSPDSAQHFSRDSVSLSCEGNSTKWRVKRSVGSLSHCSYWGEMTGSKCNIYSLDHTDAVYWCESGSGEFSNAVNFTTRYNGVILVSPVHPVAEGESITLRCKMRSEGSASYLFFYKDDKLIQNDTREELTIPAVSKSHEGFYKCGGKGRLRSSQSKMSPESWLSVKSMSRPENSSYSVPLIVGLVFGLLLIILLLLLFRCTKSKDSCFNRSQSTSQSSATDQTSKQDESQCLYESIKGPEGTGNDESRDDAGSVEFRNVVYENLMYAQLLFHKNGKPPPPAADETVYSEINVGSDP